MRLPALASVTLVSLLVGSALGAGADVPTKAPNGGVNISATVLNLSRAKMSGAIRVTSNKPVADLMQVHVYAWSQEGGKDVLRPSDDLIGLPLTFTLLPNTSQTVRVGIRGAIGGAAETTYRVVVTEVAPDAAVRHGVTSVLAFNFPVYVAPAGSVERNVSWSVQAVDGHHLRLTAKNGGNVHVTVRHIALRDGGNLAADVDDAQSVLSGSTHTWEVTTANALAARPLDIEATTDDGVVRAKAQ